MFTSRIENPLQTMVSATGFEPVTVWLKVRCSTNWATRPLFGFLWSGVQNRKQLRFGQWEISNILDISKTMLKPVSNVSTIWGAEVSPMMPRSHCAIDLPMWNISPLISGGRAEPCHIFYPFTKIWISKINSSPRCRRVGGWLFPNKPFVVDDHNLTL